jgi:hypothetical protein
LLVAWLYTPPLKNNACNAALFAKQNGLCMVPRGYPVGLWLLAALTLTWAGCNHAQPRTEVAKPQPAPPLQIGEAPTKSDTPPTVADAAPSVQPKTSTPSTPFANAPPPLPDRLPAAEVPASEPPRTTGRASLLPPMAQQPDPPPPQKSSPPPENTASPLRLLYRQAADRMANTPAYIALFRRREMADGVARPEELILFKYRRDPASIYMRWRGNEAKDRELVYVRNTTETMIHIAPAPNDTGNLAPQGRRTIVMPDSPQGLGKERYAIGETGIAGLIQRYGRVIDALERGDPKVGSVKYLGKVKRPECDAPVEAVMHIIPPGYDSGLPKGGQRLWFFDSLLRFPVLVITHDAAGQEVEYYHFDNILFPGHVRDEDFSPTSLGRH